MVNLFLAVIATQFAETKARETQKMETEMSKVKADKILDPKGTSDFLKSYFVKGGVFIIREYSFHNLLRKV